MAIQSNKQEQPSQDESAIEIGSLSTHKPDRWLILKAEANGESWYRLFAMWIGDYLTSDSWRMNSGITSYQEDGEGYVSFFGKSGSQYDCWIGAEGCTGYGVSALGHLPRYMTLIPYEQFKEEFNGNK